MSKTDIEWTRGDDGTPGKVWNCLRGCTRVSPGCGQGKEGGCYAEKTAYRFSGEGQPYKGLVKLTSGGPRWTGKVACIEEKLTDPLRWRKPCRIFVNSMSDIFHEAVPDEFIDKMFAVMALCPQHTFQVLTKRAARMSEWLNDLQGDIGKSDCDGVWRGLSVDPQTLDCHMSEGHEFENYVRFPWPLPNVWLGVSVEDQQRADERIPHLLQTPAAVRWLSCEPLLGPVDLDAYLQGEPLTGAYKMTFSEREFEGVDWVVVGGESGPGARPMHPDWARRLRNQCVAAGVPYFFKQWGEWVSEFHPAVDTQKHKENDAFVELIRDDRGEPVDYRGEYMFRVGKKAAGRELDDRTWDEFPAAANSKPSEANFLAGEHTMEARLAVEGRSNG